MENADGAGRSALAKRGLPPIIKEELLAMHVYSLRNRPVRYQEQALVHALHKAAILG